MEGEERIFLSETIFGLTKFKDNEPNMKKNNSNSIYFRKVTPTTAGLLTRFSSQDTKKMCTLCQGKCVGSEHFSAIKMNL